MNPQPPIRLHLPQFSPRKICVIAGLSFASLGALPTTSVIAEPTTNSSSAVTRFHVFAFERARVVALANEALTHEPKTITSAKNPHSAGGLHDFSSDGDYWWPDPKNPDAPYIQRDGMTNPDNFVAHRQLMFAFAADLGSLGGAFRVTGDHKYSDAALKHLRAWFVDESTRMNPNLQYAQAIRNKVNGRGTGIIDTVHFAEVALAIEAMRNADALPKADVQAIEGWFREYHTWIRTHPYGKEERDAANNHGTCWVLQASAFARLIKDEAALQEYRQRFKEILLPNQMAPNGSFPKELARTKPYGYSLFNLDVMSAVAQILSTPQDNLWTFTLSDGRTMSKGVEFLAPYIADKSKWTKKPDVMYWNDWPARQPALLFGALATSRSDWLDLWKRLDADPKVEEIRRNMPIKQPVLWVR